MAASAVSGYSATVLSDAPLAYYRMGEASGTTLVDSSGNGRNGTWTGGPTFAQPGLLTSDPNTSVSFDNTDDRATVVSAAWMNVSAITLETLVNLTSVAQEMLLERDDQASASAAFQFRVSAGKVEFIVFVNGARTVLSIASNATLVVGTTYHLAATYEGTTLRLYVNGALDKSAAAAGTLNTPARDLAIGRSSTGIWPVGGRMDEVAYYGTVLSAARITAHAAAV